MIIRNWNPETRTQELEDTGEYPITPFGRSDLKGVRYQGKEYVFDESTFREENAGLAETREQDPRMRDVLRDVAPERIWEITTYNPQTRIARAKVVKDSELILDILATYHSGEGQGFTAS